MRTDQNFEEKEDSMKLENWTRRSVIFILAVALGWVTSPVLGAEKFPEKPVNAIIGYAAGGAPDLVFRPLAEIAQKHLGGPIVIVNKPGGGGISGTLEVVKAKPDGYTLLLNFGGGEHLLFPHLEKVPFDTLTDFEPIMMISYYPSGLFVKADSPWKTLEDFTAEAKKKPGTLRYSHPGPASMVNLANVTYQKMAGVTLSPIPAGGGAPALNMLLGGHVEAAQLGVPVAWPQVEGGQIRCLAYSLPKRTEMYPGAPTYVEKGFDIRFGVNQGIAAPKGTPKEIIKKLFDSFSLADHDPEFQKILKKVRFAPNYLNTEDTKKYIREMYEYYGQVVKKAGLKVEK